METVAQTGEREEAKNWHNLIKDILISPLPLSTNNKYMKIYRAVRTNFISQRFGENRVSFYRDIGMKGHNGTDFVAKDKEKIYWDCDIRGEVIDNHIDKHGGLGIKIITEGFYKHLFWHLKSFACKPGDIVESGDLIGYADNTGHSTGTHLHRGLKKVRQKSNGKWVNIDGDNGYYGGIDIQPYFKNIFIKDYVALLQAQKSILERLVDLFRKLIRLKL